MAATVRPKVLGGQAALCEVFEQLRRTATDEEIGVASAILLGPQDRRAGLLLEQLRRSRRVDRDELTRAAADALTLPEQPSPDALSRWLDVPLPAYADLSVRLPAEPQSIDALERREGLRRPAEVRELLETTDGAVVGDCALSRRVFVRTRPAVQKRLTRAPEGLHGI